MRLKIVRKYALPALLGTLMLASSGAAIPSTIVGAAPGDPLYNNSLEITDRNAPKGWSRYTTGQNDARFQYMEGGSHDGSRSVRVEVDRYHNGGAGWLSSPFEVRHGQEYRLKVWYRTNAPSFRVVLRYRTDDGRVRFVTLAEVHTSHESRNRWQMFTTTFRVPRDVRSISILLEMNRHGWMQTDGYSIRRIR